MKTAYAIPIIVVSLASALIISLRNRPANNGQPPMAEWERKAWAGTTCDFCHKNLDPDNKMDGIWGQYVACGKCAKKHHLKP